MRLMREIERGELLEVVMQFKFLAMFMNVQSLTNEAKIIINFPEGLLPYCCWVHAP